MPWLLDVDRVKVERDEVEVKVPHARHSMEATSKRRKTRELRTQSRRQPLGKPLHVFKKRRVLGPQVVRAVQRRILRKQQYVDLRLAKAIVRDHHMLGLHQHPIRLCLWVEHERLERLQALIVRPRGLRKLWQLLTLPVVNQRRGPASLPLR